MGSSILPCQIGCIIVDSTLLSLRKPPHHRYGGAAFKENIMKFKEQEKILEYLAQRENEKFCHILAKKLSSVGVKVELNFRIDTMEEIKKDGIHLGYRPIHCLDDVVVDFEEHDKKYCCTCDWYTEFEGVCCCGDSEFRADFRSLDDSCNCWTSREDKLCEKKI